ncbi:hypothetical protein L1987_12597 [Smallanthus sonchifolius]|uniref:Uncharacterized protein n=1 Tax=Smallanthus sonchifolius TaxID=185202 RepID=A0ACB9JGT8_9ASTR|nr:hypothetical protein L1987_12597 [Smallanthus sonchifolius]
MNQPNMSKTPSSSALELPVKRKRGRPRKDESMPRNEKRQIQTSISPSQPPTIVAVQPPQVTMNHVGDNHNMVGQVVTGVIDGLFDAGYLISVRVGPNNTLLRGLVFQQGHFCPTTPANDVAPHLNMCRRESFQIPTLNQTQLCTPSCAKQPPQLAMPVTRQNYQTNPMLTGGSSNSSLPPPENLRMVGQDEFMQVFDVSKMVEEPPKNDDCGRVLKNDSLLSDSDLMAESFYKNDIVKHASLPCDAPVIQDFDHESAIDDANKQKQHEREYSVSLTCVETAMVEPPPSFEIDESEKQGEVSKINVNQVPTQGLATDLFQTD